MDRLQSSYGNLTNTLSHYYAMSILKSFHEHILIILQVISQSSYDYIIIIFWSPNNCNTKIFILCQLSYTYLTVILQSSYGILKLQSLQLHYNNLMIITTFFLFKSCVVSYDQLVIILQLYFDHIIIYQASFYHFTITQ